MLSSQDEAKETNELLYQECLKIIGKLKGLDLSKMLDKQDKSIITDMNKPIEDFSDEELLAVIRRAENSHIPGSLYQRASNEWKIRHDKKMLDAVGQSKSGVFFEVGGDMTNHGVIQTATDAVIGVAVAGNYSSNDNTKIIQNDNKSQKREWYEKPFGIILLTVLAGLIVAFVAFKMQWL